MSSIVGNLSGGLGPLSLGGGLTSGEQPLAGHEAVPGVVTGQSAGLTWRSPRDSGDLGEKIDNHFSVRLWDGTMIPLGKNAGTDYFFAINDPGVPRRRQG